FLFKEQCMSGNARHLFTSESVTEGHPDKIADQISDAILDAILAKDPVSRVACETLVTTGLAIVAGRITTTAVIEYPDGVRTPVRVDAVVVSSQHSPDVTQEQMRADVFEKIVKPTIPAAMMDKDTKIYVNPTGRFVVGGPHGDAGVTGRKIIVDTYGGAAPHGGGAFSGKDPTKVDRSACYMARYIAKNVVAAGIADRALVQLAYAIGVADPVSVAVHTEGTGQIPEEKITQIVRDHFKLTPRGIMEELDLRRPIYKKTAAFGHFGRSEPEFTWERTDKASALRAAAGL